VNTQAIGVIKTHKHKARNRQAPLISDRTAGHYLHRYLRGKGKFTGILAD